LAIDGNRRQSTAIDGNRRRPLANSLTGSIHLADDDIRGKISAAGVSASESGLYFTVWYLEAGSVMRPAVI